MSVLKRLQDKLRQKEANGPLPEYMVYLTKDKSEQMLLKPNDLENPYILNKIVRKAQQLNPKEEYKTIKSFRNAISLLQQIEAPEDVYYDGIIHTCKVCGDRAKFIYIIPHLNGCKYLYQFNIIQMVFNNRTKPEDRPMDPLIVYKNNNITMQPESDLDNTVIAATFETDDYLIALHNKRLKKTALVRADHIFDSSLEEFFVADTEVNISGGCDGTVISTKRIMLILDVFEKYNIKYADYNLVHIYRHLGINCGDGSLYMDEEIFRSVLRTIHRDKDDRMFYIKLNHF